jgi:hypothetical protein
MRAAPQSGFSALSLRMRACIAGSSSGRPGLDFQRQNSRKAVVCHFLTVAGFMTCARSSQRLSSLERMTHRILNAWLKRGEGALVDWMSCLQTASWLCIANALAARVALGSRRNHR